MERATRSSSANLRDSYLVATQLGARTSPLVTVAEAGLALLVKPEVFAGTVLPLVRLLICLRF